MKKILLVVFLFTSLSTFGQKYPFNIRTITAGVTLKDLSDTVTVHEAIAFLKEAKAEYTELGYEVQTLRLVTQNLHELLGNKSHSEALPFLKILDQIAVREELMLSIGELLPPDEYDPAIADWTVTLITQTQNLYFSLPISTSEKGAFPNSIRAAAEIAKALSENSAGGEANFRFTASANCPSEIPFFPAATHRGARSFGIGVETPNILREVFQHSDWSNAQTNLKTTLESHLKPLEGIAQRIAQSKNWTYNGIDTSPAPGPGASIGEAIETLTQQPFGGPSTLRACALITDVLKGLDLKILGYSGLMLPIIEDNVLAQRNMENRFTIQELLLFSSVSGTGLDVVPIPGDTPVEAIERIYADVAALSLKYTNKALSARLFLIPGKLAGELATFTNPFLTASTVMKVE
ncbi:hypothetical protein DFQ04_2770 [Algoriphagus boseongensis]|uniref:DUF711 family protein n=1 Tax=Algoriphagus boseongensis TaxID=1442587 RepID=A0A4R6T6Q2_9BACT|nr:DUF711 family protein [Algoriphagus boseongensis]TDQ16648.1 hypothetical protein DFQ04_2770 [Algoriphagus boseongensis]